MKFLRRRRADIPREEERENEDLAPVLFAPRPAPPVSAAPPSASPVLPVAPPRPKTSSYVADPIPADQDVTVQLLPGRLEPLTEGVQQEIRFVKVAGITRFTFGRSPGPTHTHIQLRARTASRMHGYIIFENGRWRIGNLSQTNSVVVNGKRLEVEGSEKLLANGDRIEFGELAFVFHER
jgi:pSer/pThr/pTyr-binding forkhead associated (FHA) protein